MKVYLRILESCFCWSKKRTDMRTDTRSSQGGTRFTKHSPTSDRKSSPLQHRPSRTTNGRRGRRRRRRNLRPSPDVMQPKWVRRFIACRARRISLAARVRGATSPSPMSCGVGRIGPSERCQAGARRASKSIAKTHVLNPIQSVHHPVPLMPAWECLKFK